MNFSFYKGKRVFITGHTGFKGSWMLAVLKYFGAIVKGYSLEPKNEADLYNLIKGGNLCESIIDDIRNQTRLSEELSLFEPEFVFHLAAQPLVRLSYEIPVETFDVNIMGTISVLEAIRNYSKPCVVVLITTDKVYENLEWDYPYRENDRLGGHDPYSASKACTELVISCYRNSFFNEKCFLEHRKSLSSVRAGNVIGGGDWAKDRVIPDIVKALKVNEKIIVRNPDSVRPWQHVLEPISGYLHLAVLMSENPVKYNEAWNFGPFGEDNLTVGDIAEKAIKIWGKGQIITPNLSSQLHEANLLKLDINKTVAELKWKPKWDANLAISNTINWYKEFVIYNRNIIYEQINEFFEYNKIYEKEVDYN